MGEYLLQNAPKLFWLDVKFRVNVEFYNNIKRLSPSPFVFDKLKVFDRLRLLTKL